MDRKKLTDLLDFDHELGWAVFDHVMDGLLDGGEKVRRVV